jgi:hypothetical protein
MQCPKCGYDQAAGAECSRCGVIFARVREEPDEPEPPRVAARFLASPLEQLLEPDSLHLEHDPRGWLEILTAWEIPNEYTVRDGSGRIRGLAVEQGRGFGPAMQRSFLGSHRPLHVAVFSLSEREVIMEMRRPFVLFLSTLAVSSGSRRLGTVLRRFSLLRRTYELFDSSDRPFAKIVSPLLRIWTFPIFDNEGAQRGEIAKKWSGLSQEYLTDADKFRVSFGQGWTVEQKAVLFAAALSIDFDFFENNQRR